MPKWIKTKHTGVRYREHPDRKHGVRKDRYYTIRYKLDKKDREEKLGWESEWAKAEKVRKEKGEATGRTLEQEAILRISEIKSNHASGKGPLTLDEKREGEKAKREAEAAERKARASALRTLEEYWKETYFPTAKRSKKQSSWSKEESHFRLWISPIMGSMPLKDISLHQWDELVKTLSKEGKSQRMQLYVTGTLRRILKHACERRLINEDPPSGKRIGVSSPGNNRRLRVISHEEEALILGDLELRDPHAWRVTRFAFLSGCRVSEAFNLVWSNVDFSQACIIFPDTKNKDSRTIPLTPPLQELLASMEADSLKDRVFPKDDGTPYTQAPSAFRTAVDKLELNKERSKRDRLVFHSIRHTVATRLAQKLGPRDLMDLMGWRTVEMAMRYVHSNEDAKAKALSSLGSAPPTGKLLPFQAKA